ncbi:MAG: GumC family protein [Pseudomonadota bacterium]
MDHLAPQPPRLPARRLAPRLAVPQQTVVGALPPSPAAAPDEQGLGETLRKLWRHRLLIAACTLVIGGAATAIAWSMPSYYVSEARVLVGIQGPKVLNVESVVADVSPDAERVQNEGLLLQSRAVARQVIARLDLQRDPEFNVALREPTFWSRIGEIRSEVLTSVGQWLGVAPAPQPASSEHTAEENRMIDAVLAHLDVSILGRSHVLSVKAESQNPQTAANVANAFAELYLEQQRREKVGAMDRVDRFLMSRVSELREQVKKSDQAVEDYRRRNDLYKSTSSSVTTQQLSELNSQLVAAQTAKAQADAKLAEAQALRSEGLGHESIPDVLQSPLITALKQQLADSERRAAELAAAHGDRHPMMQRARAEVANIQGRLNAEVAKIVEGLGREARTASARYETLARNFEQLKQQMGTVNDKSIQLEALERDAAVNRNLLEAMLLRAKQTTGAENILDANAKLVSAAAPAQAPSFPPKGLIAVLGVAGGFMIGAAFALLREGNDNTFRRADQLESLTGLPVMAMIPEVNGRTPPSVQVLRQPTSDFSEALRRLYIGIESSEMIQAPRTIAFSSATPSEGKSVTVASLGRLLASNGKKVLLIDCDWRSPRLHQIFQCSNRSGLIDLLTDERPDLDQVIHHEPMSGVDVMPAGPWNPRMAHLIGAERMRQVLTALRSHYDFILLDTPPALVAADVLALSRAVEKLVFLVRWGHTPQECAVEALKQIIDAQGDVAGIVMSRVVSKQYRQYGYLAPSYYEGARPPSAT